MLTQKCANQVCELLLKLLFLYTASLSYKHFNQHLFVYLTMPFHITWISSCRQDTEKHLFTTNSQKNGVSRWDLAIQKQNKHQLTCRYSTYRKLSSNIRTVTVNLYKLLNGVLKFFLYDVNFTCTNYHYAYFIKYCLKAMQAILLR